MNAILFNIFGGITRCDEIAKGIIEASQQIGITMPVVVRLDGTNSEEGLALLAETGLENLHNEKTMLGPPKRVVELQADGIIVDTDTKLCVSGLTGREGTFHGLRNRDYGTDLVAGVTPGKGGQDVDGVPVFDSIKEASRARREHLDDLRPRPLRRARDRGGDRRRDRTVIAITEGIPVLDMMRVYWKAKDAGVRLVGPNCPGMLSPGKANVGIIPAQFFDAGSIGVVSKSGTLTYQIGNELKQAGMGNSSIVGIGGDPIVGSDFIDILEALRGRRRDRDDRHGRRDRRRRRGARRGVHRRVVSKPVVAYIAGFTAPPGKQMGHAGAIISGSSGTAEAKKEALEAKGVRVGKSPTETAQLAVEAMNAPR